MSPRTPSNILTAILLAVIVISPVRGAFMHPPVDSVASALGYHTVEATIVDINQGESTVGLTLSNLIIDGAPKRNKILVNAPWYPSSTIGAQVRFSCYLEAPVFIDSFDYPTYLAIRDTYAVCRVAETPFVIKPRSDGQAVYFWGYWGLALAQLRQTIIHHLSRQLPEPESTLLTGLLIGRADFSKIWKTRFLATGTTHIVAASGFNITLVILLVFGLLTRIRVRRQHAFWLLLVAIAVYAILAGLEPSVVRAAAMGSLVLTARQVGRKTSMRNIVLLAVAVMLAFEPRLLLGDVGFQLSVISTVALIWLSPHIMQRLTWIPTSFELRDTLGSTLTATLCTLPIIILSFGQVSLVGPIVNLLVLPLVALAMSLGLVSSVIGLISPLATVAALPAWAVLHTILWVVAVLASLPFAVIAVPLAGRVILAILALFLVILVCLRLVKKS
jgi:competence protein ComEC